MSISVYSVFTAFLWFNLFIIILYNLRKKLKDLFNYHFLPLSLVAVLCLVRLFLPIEPPFVLELESTHLLPLILHVLRFNLITIGPINISVEIVILVWLSLVAVDRLHDSLERIYQDTKDAKEKAPTDNPLLLSIFERVKRESPTLRKCKLCVVDDSSVAFTSGFISSVINFPEEYLSFSDDAIYYVLKHEWQHHREKDNLIKLLVEVLCCIMWWNPLVRLLQPIINALLEFKCDANAMKGGSLNGNFEYFEAVIEAATLSLSKASNKPEDKPISASFVVVDNDTDVTERCNVFFRENDQKRKRVPVSIACFIILFLVSFCFVIQPFGLPPEESFDLDSANQKMLQIVPETSFLVDNKDGTYSLFVNGKCQQHHLPAQMIEYEPYKALPISTINYEEENQQ